MNMLAMLSGGEGTYLTSLSTSVLKNAYREKSEEHTRSIENEIEYKGEFCGRINVSRKKQVAGKKAKP